MSVREGEGGGEVRESVTLGVFHVHSCDRMCAMLFSALYAVLAK